MNWSHYQQSVFGWVRKGSGNAILKAFAGSSKTTTSIEAVKYTGATPLLCAYGRQNQRDLEDKLKKAGYAAWVKGSYGIGRSALVSKLGPRLIVDNDKYRLLCNAEANRIIRAERDNPPQARSVKTALSEMVKFCQVSLTDPTDRDAFEAMVSHFTIDLPYLKGDHVAVYQEAVTTILEAGQNIADDDKVITFTDMIWLPHVWDLYPPQHLFVIGDEVQDWSRAQVEIVRRSVAAGGRVMCAGDERQAVFGFAGSDAESYSRVKSLFDARELMLPICYRCGKEIVRFVQAFVPEIEPWVEAPLGKVIRVRRPQLEGLLENGDTILCRLTAPLVGLCLSLISQSRPARIKGHNIAKRLCDAAREIGDVYGFEYAHFGKWANYYYNDKASRMNDDEGRIAGLADIVEALKRCWAGFKNLRSVDDLCGQIEDLFIGDDERAPVTLSTVHSFKGLESDRVFILHPEKLPLYWPKQQPWQERQEENLTYVAYTRARQELIFVEE